MQSSGCSQWGIGLCWRRNSFCIGCNIAIHSYRRVSVTCERSPEAYDIYSIRDIRISWERTCQNYHPPFRRAKSDRPANILRVHNRLIRAAAHLPIIHRLAFQISQLWHVEHINFIKSPINFQFSTLYLQKKFFFQLFPWENDVLLFTYLLCRLYDIILSV